LDTLDQTEVKRFALTGILVSMTCPALKNSYLKKKKKNPHISRLSMAVGTLKLSENVTAK